VIVPIVAMTVVMGVVPNLFLRPMEPSVNRMLSQVHQRSGQEFRASTATRGVPTPLVPISPTHERPAVNRQ